MSGILDNKSRIIDAILTVEGRRQMAEGTFEVSYVTFTDLGVSYIPDASDGHEDPTGKIYLEACNLPQDQITFEANDEGNIKPFRNQDIKVYSPDGNVKSSMSEGVLSNGRLTAYERHYGRRIKASLILEDSKDFGKGFIYSDTSGLTGSVLINPNLLAGSITTSGPPYISYIGSKGGMGPQQFAQMISSSISSLRNAGGPDVICEQKNNSVYLDVGNSITGVRIFPTGSLSSITVEEAAIGGRLLVDEIENANFASQIQGILTSSFDNFVELQSIASVDRLFEDDKFTLSSNDVTFDLSKVSTNMLRVLKESPPSLNVIDSIFSDDKLSHLENFMYLPPIVKTSDSAVPDKTKVENLTPYLLGDYPSWGNNEKMLSFSKLMNQMEDYKDTKEVIDFIESSNSNRVIGQIFEVKDDKVSKLDVVDFGYVMNDVQEPTAITNKVFFAGKTYLDNRGTTCFVNMFTLIFSKKPKI